MQNNWFPNVLGKSNFATLTPFGSVSCFVVWICMPNYNLDWFLIHQASYSKRYQWYLIHWEVLGSIRKIGRYPIKVSEVLPCLKTFRSHNMPMLYLYPSYNEVCYKQTALYMVRYTSQPKSHTIFHNQIYPIPTNKNYLTGLDKQKKFSVKY